MRKILLLALTGVGFIFANSANAGADQSLENNTCYIFKQNKLNEKAMCQVYSNVGANAAYPTYAFENYRAKLPKSGIVDVVNSSPCESENKCTHTHTINNNKAISQYRYAINGYKIVSEKQAQKMSNSSVEKLLKCDKAINGTLEICTGRPYGNTIRDDFPKWTGYND